MIRNLAYSNGKLLAQTTQIQNSDFTVTGDAALRNRAATAPADGTDGLQKIPWLELIRSEFIEMVFRAAEADPNAFLLENEWRLEFDTRIKMPGEAVC